MPELPEVERVRLSLEPVVGRRVVGVELRRRDVLVVPGDPRGGWSRVGKGPPPRPKRYTRSMLLDGMVIERAQRHGKRLALVGRAAGSGHGTRSAIEIGLGMTGGMRVLASGAQLRGKGRAHCHAVWRLDDGSRMVFMDARRFGGLWAWPDASELDGHWAAELGPDALSITDGQMFDRLTRTRQARAGGLQRGSPGRAREGSGAGSVWGGGGRGRSVKAALLDQATLAGVGNIYADESLFAARIHPRTRACELERSACGELAGELRRILRESIEQGGSTLRDFADSAGAVGTYQRGHLVYGREGEACVRCGGCLESSQVAQRTTVWCRACQPLSSELSTD